MKEFLKGFLKGHMVWTFGALILGFIMCFLTKDMPNETAAGWFIAVMGSACAIILQGWYHKEYATAKYDWFNVCLAIIMFIFAGIARAFINS